MIDAKKEQPTWRDRLVIGVSEVIYLVGLLFFFLGLWIWIGLGQALFSVGAVLIGTAFINAQARDKQAERKHAV